MQYDASKHHRRSIRLKGFDYRQPAYYFVTIVAHERECIFGEIVSQAVRLSPTGEIIRSAWLNITTRFPSVKLDEFTIMPNHLHAILAIEAEPAPDTTMIGPSLGEIIGAYKSHSTHEAILAVRRCEIPRFSGKIWQRNYYEHIIRSEAELHRTRQYICDNPAGWLEDQENPGNW